MSPTEALQDRFLRVLIALGAICAFLMVYGFATEEKDRPGALQSPLAQAAERTTSLPGARISMTGVVSGPTLPQGFRMDGGGVMNGQTNRSRLDLTTSGMPNPPGNFTLTQVSDGAIFYMYSPLFAAGLPDGKTWMKLDLTDLVAGDTGGMGDPRDSLEQLKAAGQVQELGTEAVRGTETTHYAAVIDVNRHIELLREEGQDRAADLLAKLREDDQMPATIPTEVWIDDDGLIRRQTVTTSIPDEDGGAAGQMQMTIEIYDFGIKPVIDVPSESRVFDATDLAKDQLDF